jgi:putative Mn2+ efflux pump MntP
LQQKSGTGRTFAVEFDRLALAVTHGLVLLDPSFSQQVRAACFFSEAKIQSRAHMTTQH